MCYMMLRLSFNIYHSKTSYVAMYAHCCMYTIVFCLMHTVIAVYLSVNNYVCMLLYVYHHILLSIHCYISLPVC